MLPPHSKGVAPNVRYPCHVLSDLHLGHFASKIADPNQLSSLFAGAKSVIFAGDTCEAHIPSLAPNALSLRARLLEALSARNIQVIELPGNHDPAIAPHTHALLAKGQILVLHGDALFHHGIPWGRELEQSLPALDKVTQAFGDLDKLNAQEFLGRANAWVRSMAPPTKAEFTNLTQRVHHYVNLLFPPKRVFCMADAVLSAGRRACDFALDYFPQVRFIVHGHTHLGRIVKCQQRIAINTGAFVRIAKPRLVVIDEKQLRVFCVKQNGSDFVRAKQTHEWNLS